MQKKSIIILGAGPTGLSTAYLMRDDLKWNVTLLEKSKQVGGLSGSFKWNDHTIDFGPHRLSPNLNNIITLIKNLLGSKLLEDFSDHGVQIDNTVYKFPVKISQWLNIKSLLWISKAVFSFLFSNFTGLFLPKKTNFSDIMKQRFGSFLYNQILKDMTTKVWINPQAIDPSFADERFSLIKPIEILKSLVKKNSIRNPNNFYYPELGYQQIWDEMKVSCDKNEQGIITRAEFLKCHIKNNKIEKIFWKNHKNNKILLLNSENSRILSTIPISLLCKGIETNNKKIKEVKYLSSKIKIRSMILCALEFNQNKTLPHRTMIFPSKKIIFNRLFEQNLYSRKTVKNNKSVIVADITCDPNDKIYKMDEKKIANLIIKDLKDLKYINFETYVNCKIIRVPFAYMVPDVESRNILKSIVSSLSQIENLDLLGRFSIGEYDNSDYAIQNAINYSSFLKTDQYIYNQFRIKQKREIVG